MSPSVNTNHLYSSTCNSRISMYLCFLVWSTVVAICTYVLMDCVILHLWTVLLFCSLFVLHRYLAIRLFL